MTAHGFIKQTAAVPFLFAAILAGCQAPVSETPPRQDTENNALVDPPTCKQEMMQVWIGQDAGLYDPMPGIVARIVRPGEQVSADYRTDRVTFLVDEAGIITKATCG